MPHAANNIATEQILMAIDRICIGFTYSFATESKAKTVLRNSGKKYFGQNNAEVETSQAEKLEAER